MKKILVTGANGYIAKHIILELYKKKYSVICLLPSYTAAFDDVIITLLTE